MIIHVIDDLDMEYATLTVVVGNEQISAGDLYTFLTLRPTRQLPLLRVFA